MKTALNNILTDTVNYMSNSQEIIENATVYQERLSDNGGGYNVTRYYGRDKELVEKYAAARHARCDSYTSPSLSNGGKAQSFRDGWAVTLTVHGLD